MSNQGDNLKSLEICLFKICGNNFDTFVKFASRYEKFINFISSIHSFHKTHVDQVPM